jgi:hypothetical protein
MNEPVLPNHSKHRNELLAAINEVEQPVKSTNLKPALAAVAVVVAGTLGFALLNGNDGQPSQGAQASSTPSPNASPSTGPSPSQEPSQNPSRNSSPAPTGKPTGGQTPTEGVPRAAAKTGDPVPWDIATAYLSDCMRNGREFAAQQSAGRQAPKPSTIEGPNGKITSGADFPVLPSMWEVTEPDSAYQPYFTAWEPDGKGSFNPYVIGRSGSPGLIVCHGENTRPDFPAPTVPDGWLHEAADNTQGTVYGPSRGNMIGETVAHTQWGRASAAVGRITLTLDGTTSDAVIRNNMWFISVPAKDSDIAPLPKITVYDKKGKVLADNLGSAPSPVCYRTPDGEMLQQYPALGPAQDPATCKIATRWGDTP